DLQQDYFARHIELAFETQKPFIVHMRDCEQDILDSLSASKHQPPFQGIMHSYTGTRETAVACLKLGLHISFAGMLTYKKSEELRAVAASIPMDRLLLETDSPYLSPHPKRNHRPNEPSLMIHTAECLAEQKNVSLPEIAGYTTQNALKLFNI
ncbi:MAG: TatD family hydrolase, partial [Planctomycetota bacterium]|nr:TatD family hydrolase [Planctomycetota bacterium]